MSSSPWVAMVKATKEAVDVGFRIIKFYCALHVTNTYICTHALVYGPSMLPTFNISGHLVLADKISPRLGKVCTGDVVLVRSPVKPRMIVTKRVVGVEGDTVTYVVDPNNSDRTDTITVPKGHIWIEGDNIYKSRDSREFGAVPYGFLHARVFGIIWPLRDFGLVGRKAPGVDPVKGLL